jgi:hypothetical protein
VALGSPAGCSVRPDLSLLWPHLRLCRPPSGLCIIPSGRETSSLAAEGPQFTLPILSPRAAACTPVIPESALDDIFPPDVGLRHVLSGSAITLCHLFRDRVGRLSKLLWRSLYATAQWCCLPCSGQDFYCRASVDGVAAGLAALWAARARRRGPPPLRFGAPWQWLRDAENWPRRRPCGVGTSTNRQLRYLGSKVSKKMRLAEMMFEA